MLKTINFFNTWGGIWFLCAKDHVIIIFYVLLATDSLCHKLTPRFSCFFVYYLIQQKMKWSDIFLSYVLETKQEAYRMGNFQRVCAHVREWSKMLLGLFGGNLGLISITPPPPNKKKSLDPPMSSLGKFLRWLHYQISTLPNRTYLLWRYRN